jgi:hypothetical protein
MCVAMSNTDTVNEPEENHGCSAMDLDRAPLALKELPLQAPLHWRYKSQTVQTPSSLGGHRRFVET